MQVDGLGSDRPRTPLTIEVGLVACRACGLIAPAGTARCRRCRASLHPREPHSLQRVWAWLIAGLIAYVPANLMPMMVTETLRDSSSNTIVSGVVALAEHGSYFVALVVFIASVLIPIVKFVLLGYLALTVGRRSALSLKDRKHLHDLVEIVGRWSMVDVFVVAVLAALVQLGALIAIEPGPAAAPFALMVVFTMLAANAFDPRLIWDCEKREVP